MLRKGLVVMLTLVCGCLIAWTLAIWAIVLGLRMLGA
jgi:hypothetical protein